MRHLRAPSLVCVFLLLTGCSFLLDEVAVPTCETQLDCEVLNVRDGITNDACERHRCVPVGGVRQCALAATDQDEDGALPTRCGGDDCNDTNPAVGPGVSETCDGEDNDCDQRVDEGAWIAAPATEIASAIATSWNHVSWPPPSSPEASVDLAEPAYLVTGSGTVQRALVRGAGLATARPLRTQTHQHGAAVPLSVNGVRSLNSSSLTDGLMTLAEARGEACTDDDACAARCMASPCPSLCVLGHCAYPDRRDVAPTPTTGLQEVAASTPFLAVIDGKGCSRGRARTLFTDDTQALGLGPEARAPAYVGLDVIAAGEAACDEVEGACATCTGATRLADGGDVGASRIAVTSENTRSSAGDGGPAAIVYLGAASADDEACEFAAPVPVEAHIAYAERQMVSGSELAWVSHQDHGRPLALGQTTSTAPPSTLSLGGGRFLTAFAASDGRIELRSYVAAGAPNPLEMDATPYVPRPARPLVVEQAASLGGSTPDARVHRVRLIRTWLQRQGLIGMAWSEGCGTDPRLYFQLLTASADGSYTPALPEPLSISDDALADASTFAIADTATSRGLSPSSPYAPDAAPLPEASRWELVALTTQAAAEDMTNVIAHQIEVGLESAETVTGISVSESLILHETMASVHDLALYPGPSPWGLGRTLHAGWREDTRSLYGASLHCPSR